MKFAERREDIPQNWTLWCSMNLQFIIFTSLYWHLYRSQHKSRFNLWPSPSLTPSSCPSPSHQQNQAQTHELCFPHNEMVFNCVSVILSSTLAYAFLSVCLWLCMLTPPSGLLAWLWNKGEVTNALMEQRRSHKCTLLTKFWNLGEVTTAFSWQSFGTKEKWQI